MKHQRLTKILCSSILSVAIARIPLVAQNPAPGQQPATPPGPRGLYPPPQPGGRGDAAVPAVNPGATFLNKAIEANAAEVQLGQLAATKALSNSVKTYAQMLVKDHSMALQKLQSLQGDGNRETPALEAEHQALKTKLSGLSGTDFDRNYIDAMVSGHRDAVKLYEQEISSSTSRPQSASKPNEVEVVRTAKEQLPTIKHHLTEAENIQKGLGSSKPGRD